MSLSSEPGKMKLGQCIFVVTAVTQFTGSLWCLEEKNSQHHFSSNLNTAFLWYCGHVNKLNACLAWFSAGTRTGACPLKFSEHRPSASARAGHGGSAFSGQLPR